MEINNKVMQMMIMFLYKLDEIEACEALLAVYTRRFFYEEVQEKVRLKLVELE